MSINDDSSQRGSALSSAKQALLEKRLQGAAPSHRKLKGIMRRLEGQSHIPLSFAQQRLWFFDQLEPNSPVYNRPSNIRLTGPLRAEALERSLNEIVRRHEALRTTFDSVDGNPFQVINHARPLRLPVVDLRDLPEAERKAKAWQLASEEARRPFDLVQGPLLRATLLRLHGQEHVLLLTIHHIVFDGWSMGVLLSELGALYDAFTTNSPPLLPELPVQYGDFAIWQRQWFQGETLERQLAYWRQQLSDLPPALELPTDHPRPANRTFHGAEQSLALSKSLTERLRALSRQQGVTLFMTFLAAFQTLLYRYTGHENIVVGSPIAGRTRTEAEKLIGCFINTLVLRTDLSGDPTFHELLGRVRKVALGAYAHQDLPFEKLVEELQPERDLSRPPLFQVMLNFRNLPPQAVGTQELKIDQDEVDNGIVLVDLSLEVSEKAEGLRCVFNYSTDLFDAATIRRMLGHLQVLLEGIVADPGQCLSTLPLLTEVERQQLLVEWNDTQTEYPKDKTVHELFEAQVERTPDAVAVVFEDERLTYRELNRRANQLARHLRKLGVGPEVLVGISLERSVEMVVGLLGILKAGGAYVPLDPAYPRERLSFMLADAQVPVLLTQARLVESVPRGGAEVICLDTQWPQIAQESTANPSSGVAAENLAYVIYTSGSTGQPKGAMNTHQGICNRLLWMQDAYQLTESDRVLQKTPFSFDVSVWEFFWPLLAGARLIVARPGGHQDSAYLVKLITEQKITTLHFVPSMLQVFLEERGLETCTSLKQVMCSGEALPFELQERFFARLNAALHNLYGPTEAAVDVTFWDCERESSLRIVPIGRPIANTQIYILDTHLQPVPVGVAGELHIGGVGLARGYVNRPDLTAERFIPNLLSAEAGARLYKTGDLARYLLSGEIEYLGRLDHQVKIRGFRIELGEVEAVLAGHESVAENVVVTREDVPGEKRLVAYLVAAGKAVPSVSELRSYLKERLPDHMVPSAFMLLDALPLTPNGKMDRRMLPAPDETRPELECAFAAPRTPVEEVLARIWAEVLGLRQVGIYDNFFDLGGHSLKAIQVISRLREAFHLELPQSCLFESPTVSSLAEQIEIASRSEQGLQELPIQPLPREGEPPLSFSQERVWFIQQLEPENRAYQFQSTLRFTGLLDVAALEQSLSEIIRRHEIFRTTFPAVEGHPVQVIHQPWPVNLPVIDLQTFPESKRYGEAQRLTNKEFQKPFDLTQLPLIRWTLLQLNQQEYVLVHVEHHLVHDGWSFNVFLRELHVLYQAFSAGKPSPLAEMPIQFVDFARWQRQWMEGEVAAIQRAYWKEKLAGSAPLLELPADHPRPAVQSFRGAALRVELPLSLCESLRALSRQAGVTLFMTMLAAFLTLLQRYSKQDDICIGSGVANRRWRETEALIGMIVNTVALRTDLSGDPTFQELLGRVRKVTLEAYAHQDLPFSDVVEALRPERSLSYPPICQAFFSFHDSPLADLEFPGLTMSLQEALSNGSSKFDLNVIAIPRSEQRVGRGPRGGADGITLVWEYNTDLFEAATIGRMVGHFQMLLEGIIADPEQRLSELPLLTEAERQHLLIDLNDTERDYPKDKCIHQLFEQQVGQTPDTIAVVYQQEQLSYRELNGRANQLAHHLRKLGVGPEVLVGICLERSMEMVVALLGVLKAGGAYVPLDPTYPQERLRFMLADTEASVLLTQARLAKDLPDHSAAVICLDAGWDEIAGESKENPAHVTTTDNLAYVIYTSGSTGKPKGVCIPHRGVVRLVKASNYASLTAEEVFLQFAPISFDASTFEIWGCLLNGARLVVFPPHTPSLEELGEFIQRFRITTLWLTASLFHLMVDHHLEDLRQVRQLLAGGDVLSVPHVEKALQKLGGCRLINGYGPTESTTFTCCHPVAFTRHVSGSIPIGRAIANTQVYILDQHLQPVPVGVPGELHIGGAGLARGYLNRPELTAERFIPHPFSSQPGARLYKTGDLARYLPDGNIEFLRRLDQQVKIRGFRIELGEIEAVLGGHPAVRESVVVAREDEPGDKRLVAYVVPAREPAPTLDELRNCLKEKLPEHMMPSAFVMLKALPMTRNGKIDRQALPAPDQASLELERAFVAPRTQVEEIVAGIWAEVLKLEQVSVDDNFFELGGHSLLATQVISRMRKALQVEVPLRSLFQSATVAALASAAEERLIKELEESRERSEFASSSRRRTVSRRQEKGLIPLSFAQQRLWFLDQLEPHSPLYNIPQAIRMSGALKMEALRQTLESIVARHESLRTTFAAADGSPVQMIAPTLSLELPLIDLTELPQSERETEALRLAREEAQCSFDLERGPLMRARLLRLGEEDHVLLLNMHHIVSDGWSMGVLFRELGALYEAFSQGKPSPLAELPIQYADYAVWQREWLAGERLEEQLSYWQKQLGSDLPALELPTDRPRPAVQSYQGAKQRVMLSKTVAEQLKALSQREGATLFMTLLAAFQTLLHRYSGQDDIVVGSAIAGRARTELEGLIGFFVNTLVLRGDLSGNPTFRQLLGRVKEVALDAYAHQDLPFEKLVEELQPERSLNHTPLFQVMFTLQNAPRSLELSGLKLRPLQFENDTAKFDLTLAMTEGSEGLSCVFEYNTDLFEAATITCLLGHFQVLLEGIIANPNQRLSELPLLSEAERHQLLVEWNETATDYPREQCIHELFEAQVERTPEAIAVTFGEEQLTYWELNARANQLAHYLRTLGVGPKVLVGICLERSVEMVVGLLGILKAGGAYVPLDPTYPKQRLALMLADSQVPVLLTQARLVAGLPEHQARVVRLDTDWEAIAAESQQNPVSGVTGDHLTYVIYTSGSTGTPKGVMIQHRSLVNHIQAASTVFALTGEDRMLQFASINFDVSAQEIFTCLTRGATLVLRTDLMLESATLFLQQCREWAITVLDLPTAYWHELTVGIEAEGWVLPESIRLVIIGGERARPERVTAWRQQVGRGVRLVNAYGPTEAAIATTMSELSGSAEDVTAWREVPIGRALPNAQTYVLDAHMNPVPVGVVGELHIGGAGLARGYLNRPELTAERFIPDPFSNAPNARLYKTGDLVRYLPDGNIEFFGRLDHQVKIRGYRIELGEIEAAISQHATVRDVVVTVREDQPGDKRLVAYVVAAQNEAAPAFSELRGFLSEKLPEYMVPSAYVVVDEIPLTPNGKVDRRALPAPDRTRTELEVAYVAPRSAVEVVVVSIWGEVLDVEQIGIYDNFFHLGGHSLKATQVVSRVREALSVEVPLRMLFEQPTVAGLAREVITNEAETGRTEKVARGLMRIQGMSHEDLTETLQQKKASVLLKGDALKRQSELPALLDKRVRGEFASSSKTRTIPRREEQDLIPLSFAQQRLWFLDQLEPRSPLYNVPQAIRMSGVLKREALRQTLESIVARHESLRTTFASVDGSSVQVIAPTLSMTLPMFDVSELAGSERETETLRLMTEEAQRPFDLARGPLVRATLLRLDTEEHILLLTMHHIVSDGWSAGVFVRELMALYEAFFAGQPSPLAELPIQYADYAVWQRQWLRGEILERQLSYWKEHLAGAPAVLELPTDRPRPATQTFRGAIQPFTLSKSLSESLKSLTQQEGVTLFMTLLAAFQTLLLRYTGQDDIVVGSPISGRNRAETENLIGFFVNTLALRADLSGNPTFRQLLRRVREVALGAYAHQELPFEKLIEELQPARSMSHSPLFQVAFALQNTPRPVLKLSGLTISPLMTDSKTAKFDLTLSMREEAERLQGAVEYNTDLFDATTITRMLSHFQTLLKGIVINPAQHLSELALLTQAERHQLLVEWNNTQTEEPKDECVHELFEAQVERTPDAVAVVFEDEQLTYRQLNARANQLAHFLQILGVRPEVLVGIYMERSLEMVVGLLGILKAGGAYVPLDPAYPKDRLRFVLEDAAVPVLVTQARLVESLPEHEARVVCLDASGDVIAEQSSENPISEATSENLVYVIYTSGSTGKPKGVAIEHQQLLNYLNGILERMELPAGASFAMVSTFAADLGNTVIFPSLCAGGCLHLISRERALDPEGLADYFRRRPIDCVKIVPSHLAALQTSAHPERVLPRLLLVLGGEASPADWVVTLQALAPHCTILNHYGPTEATVGALTYRVEKDQPVGRSPTLPLGRPIANTRIYLLDSHLNPVPIGVPGELFIGGAGLARGYLNRPELTAERFILNPFSDEPDARLYKTGDLARYLPDGNIEFLGRADRQVKVRGFRVELAEIEAVLRQHPHLREAAVLAREDAPGNQRLIAYVVPSQEHAPTIAGHQRYKLPNNLAVAQLNKNETDYLYGEVFERQAYLKHGITLHDGDCIFDVGANIGLFALFANQICKNPLVYAFEPNPIAFEILSANASLYGSDIRLFNCGLSDQTKTAPFTFFRGFSLLSGFHADAETEKEVVKSFMLNQQRAGMADMAELIEQADEILGQRFAAQTFPAQLRTLSSVMEEEKIEYIDLLKINVEKSELDVLTGIKRDDWKKIKQIVLEADIKENLDKIVSLLEQQGYDLVVEQDILLENTPLRYVYAIRPSSDRVLVRGQAEGAHIRTLTVLRDALLSPRELKDFLSQRLPDYMSPSVFVVLDELPLTPNGKVDWLALPMPGEAQAEWEDTFVPPRTPTEELLAGIWAELLELERIGIHDNFFELGGHSLLVTRVISRVRTALRIDLPIRSLFETPTISGLAVTITQSQAQQEEAFRKLVEVVEGFSQERVRELLSEYRGESA